MANSTLRQLLDELTIELEVTTQEHAQHRLTPRDVHEALKEAVRLAHQARRKTEKAAA